MLQEAWEELQKGCAKPVGLSGKKRKGPPAEHMSAFQFEFEACQGPSRKSVKMSSKQDIHMVHLLPQACHLLKLPGGLEDYVLLNEECSRVREDLPLSHHAKRGEEEIIRFVRHQRGC